MNEELSQAASQREGRMFSFLIPILDVSKVVAASVASVVLLGFAGLTLAVSTVALIISTPVFIIFSPILIPATIATTVLAAGVTASSSFLVTALSLIVWLIKSRMGVSKKDNPPPKGAPPTGKDSSPSSPTQSLLEMPNFRRRLGGLSRMRGRLGGGGLSRIRSRFGGGGSGGGGLSRIRDQLGGGGLGGGGLGGGGLGGGGGDLAGGGLSKIIDQLGGGGLGDGALSKIRDGALSKIKEQLGGGGSSSDGESGKSKGGASSGSEGSSTASK